MQNKGIITFFAVLLAIACLFYLSFTWVTRGVEKKAEAYAKAYVENPVFKKSLEKFAAGNEAAKKTYIDSVVAAKTSRYLDSLKDVNVYLGSFTYEDCKRKEINLGLDLRGGMSVTLEVSVGDLIRSLSNDNDDAAFRAAIEDTKKNLGVNDNKDFITLFYDTYRAKNPNGKLAPLFVTPENKGKITYQSTNDEVIKFITDRVNESIDNAESTYRGRIEKFGIAQPTIKKIGSTGRIMVELPGAKDKESVRNLLIRSANLEFWETYENSEVVNYFEAANKKLKIVLNPVAAKDSTSNDTTKAVADVKADLAKTDSVKKDTSKIKSLASTNPTDLKAKQQKQADSLKIEMPLFGPFGPIAPMTYQNDKKQTMLAPGSAVGYVSVDDTAKVTEYLKNPKVAAVFPSKLKFMYESKPIKGSRTLIMHAIKVTDSKGKAALYGDIIDDASKNLSNGKIAINMRMKPEAAATWAKLTKANAPKDGQDGRCIAVVMDNMVYTSPRINGEIPNGSSEITGSFDDKEAEALVTVLKSGKLPAPARIVEESIVGSSIAGESVKAGLLSFVLAFVVILIFMAMYYNKAGWVANIALLVNLFFVVGVLISFGETLTLPGIAGIVLTIGLAVDANILIFERIREELALGKSTAIAIKEGFKHALSSIIDSNVTLLILGIILAAFGSGPVKGFAVTLIIGIATSLFAALILSRMILELMLKRGMNVTFDNSFTRNAFKNASFDFVGRRKLYYSISAVIIALGVVFYFKNGGFNLGVDFKGGRTYTVRFGKDMDIDAVKKALQVSFQSEPEVKTAGSGSQLKITTSYRIADNNPNTDSEVEKMLQGELAKLDQSVVIVSQQTVGPTIATSIVYGAYATVLASCILMFFYIVVRFKKWQYGLGAVVALFHDVLVVLSLYTICHKFLPFSLEIGQDFIAAILTVMGYTMTETVVVFDRIRERLADSGKADVFGEERNKLINFALNSTLSRTILTSLTVFFVLIVIFIFGGDSLRGFTFALLIGRIIGTYSSLCISTPIVVDFDRKK